jgi:Protein of unknown function (DUF2933)
MHGNHMKHMLLGGAGVLIVLLLAGVSFGTALPYAFLLACPLMMGAMMWSMGRGNNGDRGGGRDRESTGDQYSHPGSAGSPDDDVSIPIPR